MHAMTVVFAPTSTSKVELTIRADGSEEVVRSVFRTSVVDDYHAIAVVDRGLLSATRGETTRDDVTTAKPID
jgi:hypothetical protein